MIDTDEKKIDALLGRGVAEVIDMDHLRERLLSGDQLRIKFGTDPTSPHLHVGRAVTLLKLRDFQELGHHIVFIVGNATGVIGDTSDKEAERPMLTDEEVARNMKEYAAQAGKILDMEEAEVLYNADWLNDLGYKEIGEHASAFSVHEFIMRDNIKKRLDDGKRVSLREVLYPLMQGYDSVHVKADVEVGGTDQRFNLLAGRTLQEGLGQARQDVIMTNLILGTDGRKMSSSWGNTITLTEDAQSLGEKIMNMPDTSLEEYFVHCTRVPMPQVHEFLALDDPRLAKIELAGALTALIHGKESAVHVMEFLRAKFIEKNVATHATDNCEVQSHTNILDVLVHAGAATSKSDARRKIAGNSVAIADEKISDDGYRITESDNTKILKVGKKFFVKIIVQS